MKRTFSKADKLKGSVILPTDLVMGYYLASPNSTPAFPAAFPNQRANYLLTMLQGGGPDLGPPITLGSGLVLPTAKRGLVPSGSQS